MGGVGVPPLDLAGEEGAFANTFQWEYVDIVSGCQHKKDSMIP